MVFQNNHARQRKIIFCTSMAAMYAPIEAGNTRTHLQNIFTTTLLTLDVLFQGSLQFI